MADHEVDILEVQTELRDLVSDCELTGRRTRFSRGGRPVAILIAYDDLLAMQETLDIAFEPDLMLAIQTAEGDFDRGALILPEDLLVE